MTSGSTLSEMTRKEARQWLVSLKDADVSPADRMAFDAWVRAAPENATAYRNAAALYEATGALKGRFADTDRASKVKRRWPVTVALPIAASLLMILPFSQDIQSLFGGGNDVAVQTRIAEMREIRLPDGTKVTLGPRTRIAYQFAGDGRHVRLSDGNAFFDVAHDKARPFLVETGAGIIRVVGTKFEVKSIEGQLRVLVAQGIVDVSERRSFKRLLLTPELHRLVAGQQIALGDDLPEPETKSITADATASWRNGFLMYDNAPLGEVVSDANRYSKTPILIGDDQLRELRVTGSYPLNRIDEMLTSLNAGLPIAIEHMPDGSIRLVAKKI